MTLRILGGQDVPRVVHTPQALITAENGAGKSTLLNIFHGVYQDYTGDILYNHENVKFKSVFEANHAGIAKVHQEINLVEELSVGEKIHMVFSLIEKQST